jgi:hypothetical protein
MPTPPLYTTGGTVQAGGGIYLSRQADTELFTLCQSGAFAYVLTSRQMGKSSLMVQTATRLGQEGIRSATVDLSELGVQVTAEQWYLGFLAILEEQLGLETDVVQWWQARNHLGLTQRMTQFFKEVLLVEIAAPVVIFVDEIDSTLSLDFTDDFFAAIRYFYVARSQEPAFHRLSFVLIGVAAPSDLIRDKSRTPFNIGREIVLAGFQIAEVQPLMAGLVDRADDPPAVLRAVLDWTGGQPFLTQKLCQLIVDADSPIAASHEVATIEQLVRSRILENWETQDQPEHLRTIRDRLLAGGEDRAGRLLGLYQQIGQQGTIALDDRPEQVALRLTGLVGQQAGQLQVANRIYAEVFNDAWLARSLANLRPYGGAIAAWLASGAQDESRLLRGQALQDARTWAEGKSLADDDRRFLDASQELDKRDIQKKFEAEAEAKQVLVKANRQANKRIAVGTVALGIMLTGAIVSGIFSRNKIDEAKQKEDTANQKVIVSEAEARQFQRQVKIAETNLAKAKKLEIDAKQREQQAQQQYQKAQKQFIAAQASLAQVSQEKAETIQRAAQRVQQTEEQAKLQIQNAEEKVGEARANLQRTQALSLKAAENLKIIREQKEEAEIGIQLEQRAATALRQFQQSDSEEAKRQALFSAMQTAYELKTLVKDGRSLDKYPAIGPLLALQIMTGNSPQVDQGHSLVMPAKPVIASSETSRLRNMGISPNGQTLATAENDGVIRIWNLARQLLAKSDKIQGEISRITFWDNQRIVTAGADGVVRIWRLSGQELTQVDSWQAHEGVITGLSLNPEKSLLATCGDGVVAKIWNLLDRRESKTLPVLSDAIVSM